MRRKVGMRDLALYAIAAVIVAADQYTKVLVREGIPLNTSSTPIPAIGRVLKFSHVQNTGAAFGLFPGASIVFVVVAAVVIVLIPLFYRRLVGDSWLLRVAIGLQLGGAAGNLIDRLALDGHVTDFISVSFFPFLFNVADSAVTIGTVLLGVFVFFLDPGDAEPAQDDAPQPGPVLRSPE